MPAIFETATFRAHWGFTRTDQPKSSKLTDSGVIEPNWKRAEDELAGTMAEIEQGNWEIKSAIPLMASEYATHTNINREMDRSYGVGWGYGAAFTDGIIFLCQRKVMLSDEDFALREASRNERETARKAEKLKAFAEEFPITKKRKLIGGDIFLFKGKEYNSRETADAAREAALAKVR